MKTSNMPAGLRKYWNAKKNGGGGGHKPKHTAKRYTSAPRSGGGGGGGHRNRFARHAGGLLGHVKSLAIATPVFAVAQGAGMLVVNKVPQIGGSFWYSNAFDLALGLVGYAGAAMVGATSIGTAWYLGSLSNATARTSFMLAKKGGLLGLAGYASPQYLAAEESVVLNALRSGGMGNILATNDDPRLRLSA